MEVGLSGSRYRARGTALVHLEAAWDVVVRLVVSASRHQACIDALRDEVWMRRGDPMVP